MPVKTAIMKAAKACTIPFIVFRIVQQAECPLRLPWQWETDATVCIQFLSCFKIQIGSRNFGGTLSCNSPECLAHNCITLNFHLATIMEYQHYRERSLFGRLRWFWRGLKGLARLALFFAQPLNFSRELLHFIYKFVHQFCVTRGNCLRRPIRLHVINRSVDERLKHVSWWQ